MKKTFFLVLALALIFGANPVKADTPDVLTIMSQMEDAVSAWRSGTRKITFTMRDGDKITHVWTARNAYKEFPDGKGKLLVILEPEDLKGSAHLFWRGTDNSVQEWCYYKTIGRVKRLSGLAAYDSFLGTDFTYADLGLKDPGGAHTLLGEEMYKGIKTYKVKTIPNVSGYYAHIIQWIAIDTFLPIQRNYYDAAGRLWKTKVFENVVTVDNIPKPLRVRMTDIQRKHSTEITTSEVCYDVAYLPRETFSPEKLPEAALSSVCSVNILQKK